MKVEGQKLKVEGQKTEKEHSQRMNGIEVEFQDKMNQWRLHKQS